MPIVSYFLVVRSLLVGFARLRIGISPATGGIGAAFAKP
jgi:hypothetical protein